jgi:hydroxymethylglutaryl-CoA lyase
MLWHLHGLGIETGIDLQKMVDTSVWLAEKLGRPSPSHTVTAFAG